MAKYILHHSGEKSLKMSQNQFNNIKLSIFASHMKWSVSHDYSQILRFALRLKTFFGQFSTTVQGRERLLKVS